MNTRTVTSQEGQMSGLSIVKSSQNIFTEYVYSDLSSIIYMEYRIAASIVTVTHQKSVP